jgi:protein arginine kinase activator
MQTLYTHQVQQGIDTTGGHRMLCECGKHEATIHEVIITNDKKKVERHLCEVCAREQGVSTDPYVPISQLISTSSYIMGQVRNDPEDDQQLNEVQDDSVDTESESIKPRPLIKTRQSPQTCAGCGQSFSEFKKSGLLGCPACYQIFEERVGPMIERAHEGGCSHVGKVPKRALCESKGTNDPRNIDALLGDVRQREERLESLRQRLSKSIHDEEYEHAAMLRDELTRLTTLAVSEIEIRPQSNLPQGDSDTISDAAADSRAATSTDG